MPAWHACPVPMDRGQQRGRLVQAAVRLAPGDWDELIAAFREHKLISGEIKPSTWHRVYRHHMNHMLGAVAVAAPPQNAKQLLENLARIWADKPGGRTRQIPIESTAAL